MVFVESSNSDNIYHVDSIVRDQPNYCSKDGFLRSNQILVLMAYFNTGNWWKLVRSCIQVHILESRFGWVLLPFRFVSVSFFWNFLYFFIIHFIFIKAKYSINNWYQFLCFPKFPLWSHFYFLWYVMVVYHSFLSISVWVPVSRW